MTRLALVAGFAAAQAASTLLLTPDVAYAQAAIIEAQQSGGVSTDSATGSSTQLAVFGEPLRGLPAVRLAGPIHQRGALPHPFRDLLVR
jgi:hypothetical protein